MIINEGLWITHVSQYLLQPDRYLEKGFTRGLSGNLFHGIVVPCRINFEEEVRMLGCQFPGQQINLVMPINSLTGLCLKIREE